ncbi:MAG: signal peptidase II [Omnitrophica WOR_2 bacterium GWF2_43_52]|nr:MAG: signal peptidase II [Omnitrophica WOR_2 bacterium GWA2_44_7]OGX13947.1 MAG: signal peptidase II [Omnitrophica WOR_2 bacterium GWC2_44_8]OGX20908.1 MAG: signal peptidase II [Omnitrophica WOR_2 bacterium GWF2_43_52]OGX57071.1 MAG: signal peptidase II [Omnitrophica WOR_2 bacterium RIFOXYC2_FULL_43_9]HAH21082.1 signal peptidase II [Candidatus Omnitrophota bacterium]
MHGFLLWFISLCIIILDQISKAYISRNLLVGQSLPVLRNIFHITLVHNTGIAFGLLKGYSIFFVVVSLFIIAFITRELMVGHTRNCLAKGIALSLLLGGACGNLLDRLRYGYIVDFLDFRIWPVFNIADSAITIGIMMVAYLVWKKSPRHQSS